MSLKRLIEKCAKNDRKAQAEVYQIYSGKLFAVCLKYSRNRAEAQDNLQDGFMTIFSKIQSFNHKGSFEGWMKRVVINTALHKYRQKSLLSLVTDEIPEEIAVATTSILFETSPVPIICAPRTLLVFLSAISFTKINLADGKK